MLPFIFCFSYFPFNDVCFTFSDLQISGCWGADWDETGLYVALWVFLCMFILSCLLSRDPIIGVNLSFS